jgi:hypothetical protein
MKNRQAELAWFFSQEAQCCGHDLHYMDVLDILGTLGYALIPDETAQANDAYSELISAYRTNQDPANT